MNPNEPDEEKITRWIDGELSDEEVAALLAAHPELRDEKQNAGVLGDLLRQEMESGPNIPYPDFFNHQLLKRIENEAAAAASGPETDQDLPEKAYFPFTRFFQRFAAFGALATALLIAGLVLFTLWNGSDGSEIVSTYAPDPKVEATTFYSDEANATVLLLEGLDEIPAQREIRGVQTAAHAPAVAPPQARITFFDEDNGRPQLVLMFDDDQRPALYEVNL